MIRVLLVFMTRFSDAAAMLNGIAQFERTHGPWAGFLDDQAKAASDPTWLRSMPWDGVISRHTTPEFAEACRALRIPLVDVHDCPLIPGVPKLRPNSQAIGHLGAEHLMERGFRSFGFCGFRNHSWACERRDGFVEALEVAGFGCDLYEIENPSELTPIWHENQVADLSRWLVRLPKPAAVMACNDLRALQVLHAAHFAHLQVPEDVAVLGANNDAIRCNLAQPPLSSVAPDSIQQGFLAAETLARLMAGKGVEASDLRIDPLEVMLRRSTDLLAIEDTAVRSALRFIRDNATRNVSVDDVARHASVSRSKLERRFRSGLGRSPHAEIRRVQIEHIKRLLAETDLPLKKIADLIGFEYEEYMYVVFKRLTGENPGAFRKRLRQGTERGFRTP